MTRSPRFVTLWVLLFAEVSLCYVGSGPHPTRVDEKTNCLECHADHATGVHVHPAVEQGCLSCHSIATREDASYVAAKPSKTIICFECHEAARFAYSHFPYATGDCLRCHNPHVSAISKLLRANLNDLCLGCHLRTPESAPSRYKPTIALSAGKRTGHPYDRHPVSGIQDPLTGSEMSCVSCHQPHGGAKAHLLKMAAQIPEDALNQNIETNDMCRKCHMRLWGLDGNASGKKKRKGK